MTYGQIEAKVRTLVNDTEVPYRFSADDTYGFISAAVRHLRNINPSEKYGPDGLLDEDVPAPGLETEVRFHPRHEEAIVKYAASMAYELDSTDTMNLQLSEALRTRAEALMQL